MIPAKPASVSLNPALRQNPVPSTAGERIVNSILGAIVVIFSLGLILYTIMQDSKRKRGTSPTSFSSRIPNLDWLSASPSHSTSYQNPSIQPTPADEALRLIDQNNLTGALLEAKKLYTGEKDEIITSIVKACLNNNQVTLALSAANSLGFSKQKDLLLAEIATYQLVRNQLEEAYATTKEIRDDKIKESLFISMIIKNIELNQIDKAKQIVRKERIKNPEIDVKIARGYLSINDYDNALAALDNVNDECAKTIIEEIANQYLQKSTEELLKLMNQFHFNKALKNYLVPPVFDRLLDENKHNIVFELLQKWLQINSEIRIQYYLKVAEAYLEKDEFNKAFAVLQKSALSAPNIASLLKEISIKSHEYGEKEISETSLKEYAVKYFLLKLSENNKKVLLSDSHREQLINTRETICQYVSKLLVKRTELSIKDSLVVIEAKLISEKFFRNNILGSKVSCVGSSSSSSSSSKTPSHEALYPQ